MEQIASSANLNQAYKRVKANRGAPGVDGMTVDDLRPWIAENKDAMLTALLDGSYRPQPGRGVEVPRGAAHWRQTRAADHPPLSGGRDDAVRRQHRATRRHAARRSAHSLNAKGNFCLRLSWSSRRLVRGHDRPMVSWKGNGVPDD